MSFYTDVIKVRAYLNVQYDFRSAPSSFPTPDLANGTVSGPFDYGGAYSGGTLKDVFGDVVPLGVLNYGATEEEARWIITNVAHILPIQWELEISDFDWPANTLAATSTQTVTCVDSTTFTLSAPANTYREITSVTGFVCPA